MDPEIIHVEADVVEGVLSSDFFQENLELVLVHAVLEEHHFINTSLSGDGCEGSNGLPFELMVINLDRAVLPAPLMSRDGRLRDHHLIEVHYPEAALPMLPQLLLDLRYPLLDALALAPAQDLGVPDLLELDAVLQVDFPQTSLGDLLVREHSGEVSSSLSQGPANLHLQDSIIADVLEVNAA